MLVISSWVAWGLPHLREVHFWQLTSIQCSLLCSSCQFSHGSWSAFKETEWKLAGFFRLSLRTGTVPFPSCCFDWNWWQYQPVFKEKAIRLYLFIGRTADTLCKEQGRNGEQGLFFPGLPHLILHLSCELIVFASSSFLIPLLFYQSIYYLNCYCWKKNEEHKGCVFPNEEP